MERELRQHDGQLARTLHLQYAPPLPDDVFRSRQIIDNRGRDEPATCELNMSAYTGPVPPQIAVAWGGSGGVCSPVLRPNPKLGRAPGEEFSLSVPVRVPRNFGPPLVHLFSTHRARPTAHGFETEPSWCATRTGAMRCAAGGSQAAPDSNSRATVI